MPEMKSISWDWYIVLNSEWDENDVLHLEVVVSLWGGEEIVRKSATVSSEAVRDSPPGVHLVNEIVARLRKEAVDEATSILGK